MGTVDLYDKPWNFNNFSSFMSRFFWQLKVDTECAVDLTNIFRSEVKKFQILKPTQRELMEELDKELGTTQIEAGDRTLVVCKSQHLKEVQKLFM